MNRELSSLAITSSTTLDEVLSTFENSDTDLVLIDERSVVSQPHLELLTDYPRSGSAALVVAKKDGDILVRQSRIASASSESHRVTVGNRENVGVLRLSQEQRPEIIDALKHAATFKLAGNALDLTLVALVRSLVIVDAVEIIWAPSTRTSDPIERDRVSREIAAMNMNHLRLRMANRANDGFYSVWVLRKFSKLLTWVAVRIGATPNQVTLVSFAIGLFSAYCFSQGGFWNNLIGALLLQLSIIVDCVDGELARYTRKFSKLGAWLDAVTDRVKEYLVFLGLAFGAAQEGKSLWLPAMLMMVFQTFRHLSDYNFARIVKLRAEVKPRTSIEFNAEFDGIIPGEREPKGRLRFWLGKIIQFPIGERWLVISASAVIGGAAFTFTIMPILALISATFVFRGRIRRMREWEPLPISTDLIASQLDLLGVKRSFTMKASWMEPSIVRLIESLILISIFVEQDLLGVGSYLLLFSIIFNHYDNLYRALQGERKPLWLSAAGLYVGGRVLAIGAVVALGWSITLLTWYFGLLFLLVSSGQWVISHRQAKRG